MLKSSDPMELDEYWMRRAMAQAHLAAEMNEVPVGAVLVKDGALLAQGHNLSITSSDPTAHAEIVVLRQASKSCDNYRLPGTTLYVTLEPCSMCLGAMLHARVERLVFAASDSKTGAAGSVIDIPSVPELNHHLSVVSGVLAETCASLLRDFFKSKRQQSKI